MPGICRGISCWPRCACRHTLSHCCAADAASRLKPVPPRLLDKPGSPSDSQKRPCVPPETSGAYWPHQYTRSSNQMEACYCQAIVRTHWQHADVPLARPRAWCGPIVCPSSIPLSHAGHLPWHNLLAALRLPAHVEPLLCGRCRFTSKAGAPSPSRKTGFPFRFTEAAMRAA